MKKLTIEIRKTPDSFDADDVWWVDQNNTQWGYGYRGKGKEHICLTRCPECARENYAIAVSAGICTWCNFDANVELNKEGDKE